MLRVDNSALDEWLLQCCHLFHAAPGVSCITLWCAAECGGDGSLCGCCRVHPIEQEQQVDSIWSILDLMAIITSVDCQCHRSSHCGCDIAVGGCCRSLRFWSLVMNKLSVLLRLPPPNSSQNLHPDGGDHCGTARWLLAVSCTCMALPAVPRQLLVACLVSFTATA
jgi:hypothetical protein